MVLVVVLVALVALVVSASAKAIVMPDMVAMGTHGPIVMDMDPIIPHGTAIDLREVNMRRLLKRGKQFNSEVRSAPHCFSAVSGMLRP